VSAHEHETTVVPFEAGDGRPLDLLHVTGRHAPVRGPVLLVHGAGVRADIFRPPPRTTLVDALVAGGWDVWLENWRASIDHVPCRWTLDQAAVHDHPRAVRTVLDRTGADTLQAVVHCQGSTSFTMAAVAGLLPEVTSVVSNAVSLHPVIPRFSRFKIKVMAAMVAFVRLAHHECDNTVCKMVSFTYGTGFPALWSHENLDDETHEWIRREFAAV